MIHIDGSQGEGGGQILRTALSLSALLGKPVTIGNIRANRRKPGLRPQHLLAVHGLSAITDAETHGAYVDSGDLVFIPKAVRPGAYRFDVGTAGSTSLIAAALLPPLLFASAPSEILITGGTHVPFSPVFHYLAKIFLPALTQMGCRVGADLQRWGWYPAGGGQVRLHIKPCRSLQPIVFTSRGTLQGLHMHIGSSLLPQHVAEREQETAERILVATGHRVQCRTEFVEANCPGNMVFLEAVYANISAGFSALGQKGKPAEEVAREAVGGFREYAENGRPVDKYLADQLLLFMALAGGRSAIAAAGFTEHLRTNIAIIEKFLPVIFFLNELERMVIVDGADFVATSL
jgi:RNA 3'-terminal phosphate cyclase (ATP)